MDITSHIKNLLPSIHPLFRVPCTTIYWIGQIQKEKSNHKQRFLVVATPGLFEIQKRYFLRNIAFPHIFHFGILFLF